VLSRSRKNLDIGDTSKEWKVKNFEIYRSAWWWWWSCL